MIKISKIDGVHYEKIIIGTFMRRNDPCNGIMQFFRIRFVIRAL